jgi:hypothetical protein
MCRNENLKSMKIKDSMQSAKQNIPGKAGWQLQFRFAVHSIWSRVPELWTLAGIMRAFLINAAVVSVTAMLAAESRPTPTTIPAKVDRAFTPEVGVDYLVATGSVYRASEPNPLWASLVASLALDLANEFVYRTALSQDFKLPGYDYRVRTNADYTIFFRSTKGATNLQVGVTLGNRTARIMKPDGQEDGAASGAAPRR